MIFLGCKGKPNKNISKTWTVHVGCTLGPLRSF